MLAIAAEILPIFALIFLGTALHKSGFLPAEFWRHVERLTYFVLFPVLIVSTLAETELVLGEVVPMALAIDGAILAVVPLAFILRRPLRLDGPAFGSMMQGIIRFNIYLALAVVYGLYGSDGLAKGAIAVAAIVPLVNLICVITLIRHGDHGKPRRAGGLMVEVLRNPLILACAIGIALNAFGLGLPPVVAPVMEILGRAALAIGLLAVGAGLDFEALKRGRATLATSAAVKLLIVPGLTALGCLALGVGGPAMAVAILFNGMPTATSSYILARQLGGDASMMAALITGQTALSMITLPFILQVYV